MVMMPNLVMVSHETEADKMWLREFSSVPRSSSAQPALNVSLHTRKTDFDISILSASHVLKSPRMKLFGVTTSKYSSRRLTTCFWM